MKKYMFLWIFLVISFIGNLQGSAPTPERSISLSGRGVMRAITVNDICARAQQELAQYFPSICATSGGGSCSALNENQRKALTNAAEALRDSTATIAAGVTGVEIKITDHLAHCIERILGMGVLSPDSAYTQSITHILTQYRQPRGYDAWHRPTQRRGDGTQTPVELMSLSEARSSRSHLGGVSTTVSAASTATATVTHSASVAEEDADVCPICFIAGTIDPKNPIISLSCGHEFHSTCIAPWLSQKISEGVRFLCPKCRAQQDILPEALARLVSPADLFINALLTHNDAQVFATIHDIKNVNAQYPNHWTLLHIAAAYGHIEAIKMLLSRGANIQEKSQRLTTGSHGDVTPLHVAAWHNKKEAVIELLNYALSIGKFADVRDAQDQCGHTPLIMAIKSGHLAIVELLLTQHVDINALNKNDRRPLDYAQGDVASLLRANGAIKGPPLKTSWNGDSAGGICAAIGGR